MTMSVLRITLLHLEPARIRSFSAPDPLTFYSQTKTTTAVTPINRSLKVPPIRSNNPRQTSSLLFARPSQLILNSSSEKYQVMLMRHRSLILPSYW